MIGYFFKKWKRDKEHAAWCKSMENIIKLMEINRSIIKLHITSVELSKCKLELFLKQEQSESIDNCVSDINKLKAFLEPIKMHLEYQVERSQKNYNSFLN